MADIIRLSGVPFQAALLPDFLPLPLHNLRQLFRKAIAVRIEEQTAAEILIFGDIIADFSDQDRLPCAVFKNGGFLQHASKFAYGFLFQFLQQIEHIIIMKIKRCPIEIRPIGNIPCGDFGKELFLHQRNECFSHPHFTADDSAVLFFQDDFPPLLSLYFLYSVSYKFPL